MLFVDEERELIWKEGFAVFRKHCVEGEVIEYKITADAVFDAILLIINHQVNSRVYSASIEVLTPTPYDFVRESTACAVESTATVVGVWPREVKRIYYVRNDPPYRGSAQKYNLYYFDQVKIKEEWVGTFDTLEDAKANAGPELPGEDEII